MADDQKTPKGANEGSMTKFYYVLGVVAVIAIGVVGYTVGSEAMGSAQAEPVELDVENDRELVEMAQGVVQGNPDAPVSIVEFGDFQCPGCGGFARQVKPMIDLNLVQAGKANFVFYDFPLTRIHSNSFLASRAARCAGDQNAFWEYHDKLFSQQSQWASAGNPTGRFVTYAEELGLGVDDFEGCLKSDRHADTITANMRLGEALGVNGTPTIMVSQGEGMARRMGNPSYSAIEEAVNSALEQQGGDGGSDSSN